MRRALKDELGAFREAITDAAKDLVHERGSNRPISRSDIKHEAETRFKRPLRDLNRKLAHPHRDLLRNLAKTQEVMAGFITFAFAWLTGSPQVMAALYGFSVAMIPALLETYFARQEEIEQSGVAFLVRAREKVGALEQLG